MLVLYLAFSIGPLGVIPFFALSGIDFACFRRYLSLWPAEVGRVYRLLAMVGDGCPGHGPIHLLSSSAADIGFRLDLVALAWVRPGLPLLSNLAGPIQHFRSTILDAWRNKVAADLCGRKGFSVEDPCLMFMALCSSLILLMLEKETRVCFVVSWLGASGMVFCWVVFVIRFLPCRFCGASDHDGSFVLGMYDLMRMDKAHWPRCLLWHGWLPMLSGW